MFPPFRRGPARGYAYAGSVAVHRRCGFETIGVLKAVGWKFDRWVDSVLMQRPLGGGDLRPVNS